MNRLIIEPLVMHHALALGELFAQDRSAYVKHFSPFELSADGVVDALSRAQGRLLDAIARRAAGGLFHATRF